MTSEQKFLEAQELVKTLTERPTDEEFLELYSLFKQGTFGDNTTDKPGFLDLKGKYKWEYWNKKKGMAKETAQEQYVAFVQTLLEKYAHT
ncbi:acyl-CoA-binding protein homolog [Macrosteles quadrilineatus]|uniref:acyl-CoA-binding protein homolog n=1 Tax=Macrosteles quadrilineatus TaxID=74068 RepID=UPI0023E1CB45|nr:acyl-CoA-binding protein homolog [Macrosteles quadrilineatus]XP_054288790.1 acyl-CoA-binding protein homolog [Macrosteles quadrilineatus]